MPKKRGKKYIEAAKKVEAAVASNGNGGLEPEVACQMVRETSISKFDATVEAHIRLGVDPRHAEQMVRGSVVLPNGTGKKVRVAVFAVGERAREAQDAGADVVGGDDLVKRVVDGWTEFDTAIATPDMMAKVDRKSTRLNSSHMSISYAVFCLKKKKQYADGARG